MENHVMALRHVDDVIANLPRPDVTRLPAPGYVWRDGKRVGLAVESMRRHMSDEGWQIFESLERNGYELYGYSLPNGSTDAMAIATSVDPAVMFVQDKREWDGPPWDFRERHAKFTNVGYLRSREDIFKLTIIKDIQQRPAYHRFSADEMGCHAWVTYYHPRIVCHMAPYIRPEHLIRTYHTIDRRLVPELKPQREGCLLSGALAGCYPLRLRLAKAADRLPQTTQLRHPGYHASGTNTPKFLQLISGFKVAICTSSVYGYALRKIIEATACGCVVITDLPVDDVMPKIDSNLIRVPHDASVEEVAEVIQVALDGYDFDRQRHLATRAQEHYDFPMMGRRLVDDIEYARDNYQ